MNRIPLWIDLREIPLNKRLPYLHAVREVGAERVVLAKDDGHHGRAGIVTVAVDGNNRLLDGKRAIGRIAKISDAKSQEKAAKDKGLIVVETGFDRIIPLENLIAARQDRPGTLFARSTTSADVRLCATVLEKGVHGILLAPSSPQEIHVADKVLRERASAGSQGPNPQVLTVAATPTNDAARTPALSISAPSSTAPAAVSAVEPLSALTIPNSSDGGRIVLEPATITRIEDGGLGDRVCIDTTSLLSDGEGLLVGSMAHSFALVHAETADATFIGARPFRVNAGAVHSYVLGPDNRTAYLAELAAGRPVLAVHRTGVARTVTVGRVKIERRPHLILHWQTRAGPASIAVQNAETIRLVRPDGTTVPVTQLQVGDAILVRHETAARHAGLPIDEHLEER